MNIEELEDKNKPRHKIGHIVYYNDLNQTILCLVKSHAEIIKGINHYNLIEINTQKELNNISEYDLTSYNSHTSKELKEIAVRSLQNIYKENQETFDASLMINGIEKTLNHASEELAELIEELSEAIRMLSKMIKQLNHYRRNRIDFSKVKEEIFDCQIILTELMLLFDSEPNKSFEEKILKYKESIKKKFQSYIEDDLILSNLEISE